MSTSTRPTSPSIKPKHLLIAGLVVMVIIIIVLRTFTPPAPIEKSPLTRENFDGSSSTFQLQFLGNLPDLPKNLPIGQASVATVSQTDLLAPLVKEFGLEPEMGEPLVWSGADYILIKDEGSDMYALASQRPAERSARLDETAIVAEAEGLAQKLFPKSNLKVIASDTRYLAGSEEQKEVAPNQAEVIELVLAPTMNNYPVMIENNSQAVMQMEFDSSQKLIEMSFLASVAGLTYSPVVDEEYPLFTVDRAVANINRGDGAIISADSRELARLDLNTKLVGQLNRVEIEYRNTDSGQLVPYYRFRGVLQLDGARLQADIITPAIDQKALPSP